MLGLVGDRQAGTGKSIDKIRMMTYHLLPYALVHNIPDNEFKMYESFCDIFQRLTETEFKPATITALYDLIVDTLVRFEMIARPREMTGGQVHELLHLPEFIRLNGTLVEAWVFSMERVIGEFCRTVRSFRHPEANVAKTFGLSTAARMALEMRADGGALVAAMDRPSRHQVVIPAPPGHPLLERRRCDVVLFNVEPGTEAGLILTPSEEEGVWARLWESDPTLYSLREEYLKTRPPEGYKQPAIRVFMSEISAWFHGGGLSDADKQPYKEAMSENAFPERAVACYRQAETAGCMFRSRELEMADDGDFVRWRLSTFNQGLSGRFGDTLYYGEAVRFFHITFLGRSYAFVDAVWYDPKSVAFWDDIGLAVVQISPPPPQSFDTKLVAKPAAYLPSSSSGDAAGTGENTFYDMSVVGGQFFIGEFHFPRPKRLDGVELGINPKYRDQMTAGDAEEGDYDDPRPLEKCYHYRVLFEHRVVGQARPDNDYPDED